MSNTSRPWTFPLPWSLTIRGSSAVLMGDSDLPRLVAAINCIKYKVPMVSNTLHKACKQVLPSCNCNQSCSSAINSEVRHR